MAVRGTKLYVTLAGSDRVAVVDTKLRKVAGYLHDAAPGAPPEGSTPNAVALTADGKRLLVAEAARAQGHRGTTHPRAVPSAVRDWLGADH